MGLEVVDYLVKSGFPEEKFKTFRTKIDLVGPKTKVSVFKHFIH